MLGDTQVARSAVEFAGRVVAQRDFESFLGSKLEAAAIPLKPAEWLLIHTGIVLGAGLVLFLVSSGRVFVTLIGLFLGFLIPWLYLSYKATQRRKAFMAGLVAKPIDTVGLGKAWRAFAELEVGGVIINDIPTYRIDHMPYGGVKDSGLGREGLRWAMDDMTEIRIMVLAQPG